MSTSVQFDITRALRAALKSRGLTYKDLAAKLDVSEQTIKRLFRERDCSLSRLVQVCDAIGISFYDLTSGASEQPEPTTTLSAEQEEFLAANPSHFAVLMHLVYKVDVAAIRERFQLSERRLFCYLRDLDRLGLIELGAHNHARLLIQGHILWTMGGPMQPHLRKLCSDFVAWVMDSQPCPERYFTGSVRYMSKVTIERFIRDMDELIKSYRTCALRDEALLPREQLTQMKWAVAIAPFDVSAQLPVEQ